MFELCKLCVPYTNYGQAEGSEARTRVRTHEALLIILTSYHGTHVRKGAPAERISFLSGRWEELRHDPFPRILLNIG